MRSITRPPSIQRTFVSLAFALAAALAAILVPVTAWADAPSIWIMGVDIVADPDHEVQCGEGTATYDPDTGVLTLENATITKRCGETIENRSTSAIVGVDGTDLDIRLIGANSIDGSFDPFLSGIITDGDVSLRGTDRQTDTLSILFPTNRFCGIYSGGAVSIESASVTLEGINTGIHHGTGLSVSNANVTVTNAVNTGIESPGAQDASVVISNNSDLNISSSDNAAILVDGSLRVTDSTLTLASTNTHGYDDCNAIVVYKSAEGPGVVSFNNSTVVATTFDTAIVADAASIQIEDSSVTATSRAGHGIVAYANTVSISGTSTVKATASEGYYSLCGWDAITLAPPSGCHSNVLVGSSADDAEHLISSPFDHEVNLNAYGAYEYRYCQITTEAHAFSRQDTSPRFLAQEATCTEPAHYYLSCACDVTSGETFEAGEPLGHDLEQVAEISPTCTEPGVAEHWTCARCDTLFSDEAGTKTVSADELALPALGHRFENGVCAVCGAKDPDYVEPKDPEGTDAKTEKGNVIPATGDPTSPVAAASALAGGALLVAGALSSRRSR